MCDLTLWAADLTSCDRGVKTARTEHSLLLTTATTQRLLQYGNTRVKLYCCLEYIVCTYTVSILYCQSTIVLQHSQVDIRENQVWLSNRR